MKVEIWSDVICPWCYVGKRRFEAALADFEHRENVKVIWHSFELDRHAPEQYSGTLVEMLAKKYGVSLQQAAEMNERVTAFAREAGLEYRLEVAKPGNTFDAHRLIHFAGTRQLGDQANERIMQSYFSESLPIGDRSALARLAPEFGIPEDEALVMLEGKDFSDAVRADEARAARFGITGVPCFVFDERTGFSGAQPVKVFAAALQEAAEN